MASIVQIFLMMISIQSSIQAFNGDDKDPSINSKTTIEEEERWDPSPPPPFFPPHLNLQMFIPFLYGFGVAILILLLVILLYDRRGAPSHSEPLPTTTFRSVINHQPYSNMYLSDLAEEGVKSSGTPTSKERRKRGGRGGGKGSNGRPPKVPSEPNILLRRAVSEDSKT